MPFPQVRPLEEPTSSAARVLTDLAGSAVSDLPKTLWVKQTPTARGQSWSHGEMQESAALPLTRPFFGPMFHLSHPTRVNSFVKTQNGEQVINLLLIRLRYYQSLGFSL